MEGFCCSKHTCPRKRERPESFAPPSKKKLRLFNEALSVLQDSSSLSETKKIAFGELEELRTKQCIKCRESNIKSLKRENAPRQICKRKHKELKERHINDTCKHCGLIFTKEKLGILEFDHIHGKKIRALSDYSFWPCPKNGSVDAMEKEYLKCQILCCMCHRIKSVEEERAKYAKERESKEYKSKHAEQIANWTRNELDKKYSYVDAKKIEIGKCQCGCDMKVTPENVNGFDFAHLEEEEANKVSGIGEMCNNTTSFKTMKPLIDAEIPKTLLKTANCHKLQDTDKRRH